MPTFQAPNPDDIRAEGADLYDEISIPALLAVAPEDMQRYRLVFAEGYLHGWAKSAVRTLEQLLPAAPATPEGI